MASLKEIFDRAQQTGKVEYTYFGGTNVSPFTSTSIPVNPNGDNLVNNSFPYIRLGYEGQNGPLFLYRSDNSPLADLYNNGIARLRDVARIGGFFLDAPQGPLWLTKQTVLQTANPDVSAASVSSKDSTSILDKLSQIKGPRFYNPLGTNTLAQVAVEGTGIHFKRFGALPNNDSSYISLNTNPDTGKIISRLDLYKNKISGTTEGNILLNSYLSGPDATWGVGGTRINSYNDSFGLNTGTTNKGIYSNTEGLANPLNQAAVSLQPGFLLDTIKIAADVANQKNNFKPWSYDIINQYSEYFDTKGNSDPGNLIQTKGEGQANKLIQDFRQVKNDKYENYPLLNVHNRIGVTTGKNAIGKSNTVDSINVINITPRSVFYGYTNSATNPTNKVPSNLIYNGLYSTDEVQGNTSGYFGRDIVKFRIELLNNDMPVFTTQNNGGGVVSELNTDVLAFRAYINNLTDNVTPKWNSFKYMGRGEDFYTYEGFSRQIQVGFTIFAHSKYEMPAIYTKLNYLMSAMAPDYSKYNQMRGTYAYLTIGDYVYQQPGVFTSMNIDNLVAEHPWEITLNEPETRNNEGDFIDKKQHEVPKLIKVNMTFNPIHNFLPKKNKANFTSHTSTFITPNWKLGTPNYYLPHDAIANSSNYVDLINIPPQNISQPAPMGVDSSGRTLPTFAQ